MNEMLYGLYLSAQGAEAQSQRLDVIANNVANASTSGFKRDLAVFRQMNPHDVELGMDEELPGNLNDMTGGLQLDKIVTDFTGGPLIDTGADLDVAITGQGFLHVTNGQNNFLTRDGQMTLNVNGELLMQHGGLNVLDQGGNPIVLPNGTTDISISDSGQVSVSIDGRSQIPYAQIGLVTPGSMESLQKQGENLYRAPQEVLQAGPEVRVKQGYLEGSGTKPVLEMLDMIETSRAFESNLNMAKHQDESLGMLLGSFART